jgi:hypothetical protein
MTHFGALINRDPRLDASETIAKKIATAISVTI